MQAMVLTAPKEVVNQKIKIPDANKDEVLIRVTKSGICGTDLKIFQGGIPVDYPRILGHESVGEVVSGENIAPGTAVIVDPAYYCGACYNCRDGQSHLCPNGGLIGRDVNGGFADYMTAPSGNVHALPDDLESEVAPLIQPMTTCLHAQRKANIFPGEAVLVYGLGVTGLLHVQLAKAHGAYPVIGVTRSEWKRNLAKHLGADFTFAPSENLKKEILKVTGEKGGVDLVIESVGKLSILAEAIELVRLGGRILPFGIYTQTKGELPFYNLYFKEIQIVNARVAKPEDYPASIDFVRRGVVDLKPLITHTFALTEIDKTLEMLDSGDSNCIKIILDHIE
ncbi:MAG: alcohol dehydrogenase catalytic domain-containing protein [Pseudomonadota bacterium]|nr:alcohol dehydrogenase catalytic domain-containing protein [Pseudomonadota bacterium]